MRTMKEIREYSKLSRAEFCRTYGIPIRTMENWETGKTSAPRYLIDLLTRAVIEDKQVDSIACYKKDILRELGYCYTALLHVLNKDGHNPYPNAEIFPTKYFTMVLAQASRTGIPQELNSRIALLMDCMDPDDWAHSMDIPVPMGKRQYWILGQMEYNRLIE